MLPFVGVKPPSNPKSTKSSTEEMILSVIYIIIGCGLGFLISCAIAT